MLLHHSHHMTITLPIYGSLAAASHDAAANQNTFHFTIYTSPLQTLFQILFLILSTSILFLLPCLSKENSFSPFALYFSFVELFSIVAVLTSAFCSSNYFDLISIVWFVVSIYVSLIYCEHLISFSLIITLAGFTTQCDW